MWAHAVLWAATPVDTHGQLSVSSAGQVVDEHGNPPQLRGMSFYWNINSWQNGDSYYTEGAVNTLADDWKASVIRLAIYDQKIDLAKQMIGYAANKGIYVIVDNHVHNAHTNTASATTYFTNLAQWVSQQGYKHVIYEIYNEPAYIDASNTDAGTPSSGLVTWATIKAYAQTVINGIRTYDKNNLVIVGTPNYDQEISAALDDPLDRTTYGNVAYAFHYYALSHSTLMQPLKTAWCKGLPMFISEWGTTTADGNTLNDNSWTINNEWMSLIESLKLSWANWSVQSTNVGASGMLSPSSIDYDGPWPRSSLSTSGAYVYDLINGLNQGNAVSGVTASTIDCSYLNTPVATRLGGTAVGGTTLQTDQYSEMSGIEELTGNGALEGIYMGNAANGAYLKFWIQNNKGAGHYKFSVKTASPVAGTSLQYAIGDSSWTAELPNTSSWSTWEYSRHLIYVPAGLDTLTLTFPTATAQSALDGFNITVLDSADSVAYGLSSPTSEGVRGFADMGKQGFHWNRAAHELVLPAGHGIDKLELRSWNGRRLQALALRSTDRSVALQKDWQGEATAVVVLTSAGRVRYSFPVTLIQ